jgi:ankyrin repeat protein
MKYGARINEKDNRGFAPLHYAVTNSDSGMIELLIKEGANVNEKTADDNENAPLHILMNRRGDFSPNVCLCGMLLAEAGASIYLTNKEGKLPTSSTSRQFNEMLVEIDRRFRWENAFRIFTLSRIEDDDDFKEGGIQKKRRI